MNTQEIIVQNKDLWAALVEESRAIIAETRFSAQMTLVEGKHQFGERIVNDPLYKKYAKGNQNFIDDLARGIGISKTELYYCIRFYLKFPKFALACKELPDGKAVTWNKIKTLLPVDLNCKHTNIEQETFTITRDRCVTCGKVVKEEKQKS